MEMSLLHAGLAAGAGLAALPVILHLFMRQTPKHVMFPALQLLRERQKQSKRRLRVKNWLLLLARMAILALMAFALARPRIYRETPLGDESQPMALGLVFDTSLSMEYKDKDKTRLEEAKERAKEIIAKIPDSSLVFVVDSGESATPVGLSPSAAAKRIDSLTIRLVNRPLNAVMGQVYPAVAECERPMRVVYVLTDLARTAWNTDLPAEGLDRLAKTKDGKPGVKIATFVLRLTPQEIQNVFVDSASPSSSATTQGDPVEIRARIRSTGKNPATRLVEFEVDGVKKGEKSVTIAPDGQEEVSFTASARMQDGDLHAGKIKLSGTPDPFERDDERFFVFKIRPPLKVLVLSDIPYERAFVAAALDPDTGGPRSFLVTQSMMKDFMQFRADLKTFACVFLLNIEKIDEPDWRVLNQYVHEGGGLVVAPGKRSKPDSYNNTIANQVLPAQLDDHSKAAAASATFGKVANIAHPLFQRYGRDLDTMLSLVPVYRYWPVKQVVNGTHTLLSFSDGSPALMERTFKGPRTGRVLMWTTPLSRRPDRGGALVADPNAWNELPSTEYGWSFLALMSQTVPYLAGTSNEELNFEAGENVLLKLPPSIRFNQFLVTGPDPKTKPRLVPSPSNEFLEVIEPPDLGIWSVKATAADKSELKMGFSVNPPRTESKFTPLEPQDLDRIFGKDNYKLAEDITTLRGIETVGRFGHEIFPWLMFLILIVVTLENFLANTFYKQAPEGNTATPRS